ADLHTGLTQRFHLCLRRALRARDDRPCVTHLLTRWRRDPGDVAHDRLAHLRADEGRGLLLFGTADLADHHYRSGIGVRFEGFEAVDKRGARHGVTTDANARRHTNALLRQLIQRLIRQRTRARDDADGSTGCRNVIRRNADIAFTWGDDA